MKNSANTPLSDVLKESFPVFGKLLAVTLPLPVSTVDYERGFSEMKITKAKLKLQKVENTFLKQYHLK